MIREWVLASNNRGKLAEFAALLAPYAVTVLPQSRFIAVGADETGATFIDNAMLKARHAAAAARLPAIADDSGLEVDALGGAPGVYSARYAGIDASDADNNAKLLGALHGVANRVARFRCALAYVRSADDAAPIIAEASWPGTILDQPRGAGGFGYDPLFMPDGALQAAGEMSAADKNAQSHRAQALRLLLAQLLAAGELSR